MFENIHKIKNKVTKQAIDASGVVSKNKAGRPRKPNMKAVIFKMDKTLHSRLKIYAADLGIDASALVNIAVRNMMDGGAQKFKMVPV